jgi:hypothetical protein
MDKLIRNSTTEFLIFTSQNGENSIEVKVFEESVWLTQTMIAQLFDVQRPAITKHLKNIFESYELDENSVSSILEHTANDRIMVTGYFLILTCKKTMSFGALSLLCKAFQIEIFSKHLNKEE